MYFGNDTIKGILLINIRKSQPLAWYWLKLTLSDMYYEQTYDQ
jgi:hypothetical protein